MPIVECGLERLYLRSMKSMTAFLASSLVPRFLRWYISFLSVPKNDSATVLSWHDPVLPTDRLTLRSAAHLASNLLVYCAPRSELNRFRFSSDYAEENTKPQLRITHRESRTLVA